MTESKFEIVPMNEKNYKDVSIIAKKTLTEGWSEETYFKQISNPVDHTFLALVNNIPAGFISTWIVADECEINNIAVDENFRKKGIASSLMRKILQDFKNVKKYFLEVRKSNQRAINLYKKFGFEIVGERKDFYTQPTENALLMCFTK